MTTKRRWWLFLYLLIPLLIGLGFARLRLDVEVLHLLPSSIPAVRTLQTYQEHFATVRELIVTVRGEDAETVETAARDLAQALRGERELVRAAVWQPPWLEHPEELGRFIGFLWLNQPPERFAELGQRLAPANLDPTLAAARESLATTMSPEEIARLSYDPLGFSRLPESVAGAMNFGEQQNLFASASGLYRVMYVEPTHELADHYAAGNWLRAVRRVTDRVAQTAPWGGGVTVQFTGSPAFTSEIASGMERDIKSSVAGTVVLIIALFWWAHRRWVPLLWLLFFLNLTVVGAMAFGGLVFGRISAISLGFAAILLGLAVDYGLVLYQELVAHPETPLEKIREDLRASIRWSSVTTAGAFGLLLFAGLPGLAQLGGMVAAGILLAPVIMLWLFLPAVRSSASRASSAIAQRPGWAGNPALGWSLTILLGLICVVILARGMPGVDASTKPLQPRNSPADTALAELQQQLSQNREPLLVLLSGRDEREVALRLEAMDRVLRRESTQGSVGSYLLPTPLWPRPEYQQANRAAALALAQQRETFRAAALRAGFTEQALGLLDTVTAYWQEAGKESKSAWPPGEAGEWLLRRFAARANGEWLALGLLYPAAGQAVSLVQRAWSADVPGANVTGWSVLGEVLFYHVEHRLWGVLAAMFALLLVCLWLAFRSLRGMVLSIGTLLFGLLLLSAIMRVAGWEWNLFNLVVLPLLLGSGVDYSIHIQMALARHGGDLPAVRRTTGRALFLCAATTFIGFGSLAFSSNTGLASLGLVCAVGVLCVYFSAAWLLPAWWQRTQPSQTPAEGPSSLYSPGLWRVALAATRWLPVRLLYGISRSLAAVYYYGNPRRREIVTQNLLPVMQGDLSAARRGARQLFQEFAMKLADLWRFETGASPGKWLVEPGEWEQFLAAQARGRGVLLVTLHLGNWELGAPLLAERGVKLLVITQAEPGSGFTELRKDLRGRWGIETLVIREDLFAFVEVINRLQAGATVALLLDRPPGPGAVTVEFFGRPFRASTAAAELARATGCAVVAVAIVRTDEGYQARLLPELTYDRAGLRDRAARQQLTQQIIRAFEPLAQQHITQWYHFVPVWPAEGEAQRPQ